MMKQMCEFKKMVKAGLFYSSFLLLPVMIIVTPLAHSQTKNSPNTPTVSVPGTTGANSGPTVGNTNYTLKGFSSKASENMSSQSAVERNTKGDCDSTCDIMGNTLAPDDERSGFATQVIPCGDGYTGSKVETRSKDATGSWGPWSDTDTSRCTCAPTYQDSLQNCASPQAGTFVTRTPWVCNSNVGSNGAPSVITNSCYTPCVVPAAQAQTVACSAGYSGSINQTRTASCPSVSGSPVWGAWTNVSNTCALIYPPATSYAGQYCSGYDLYNSLNDGSGGTYGQLAQNNSPSCGYVAYNPTTPTADAPAVICTLGYLGKGLSAQVLGSLVDSASHTYQLMYYRSNANPQGRNLGGGYNINGFPGWVTNSGGGSAVNLVYPPSVIFYECTP